jgi:hypothetical protein
MFRCKEKLGKITRTKVILNAGNAKYQFKFIFYNATRVAALKGNWHHLDYRFIKRLQSTHVTICPDEILFSLLRSNHSWKLS